MHVLKIKLGTAVPIFQSVYLFVGKYMKLTQEEALGLT